MNKSLPVYDSCTDRTCIAPVRNSEPLSLTSQPVFVLSAARLCLLLRMSPVFCDNISDRVQRQIEYCLNMKPDASSYSSLSELRAKLDKIVPCQSESKQLKLRSSGSANSDKKKSDHASHEPSSEIIRLNKNFECLIDFFRTILDNLYELNSLKENFASLDA